MKKVTLKIEGMNTPCCAEEVKEALLKVKGVKKAFYLPQGEILSHCPTRKI